MISNIKWLDADDVRYFHEQILEPGQLTGEYEIRSIESALERVKNQVEYGQIENDVLQIASAYAVVIARAHSFADGNKRTALMSLLVFLDDHDFDIVDIDDDELVRLMKEGAAGDIDEQAFYDAIFDHLAHLEQNDWGP